MGFFKTIGLLGLFALTCSKQTIAMETEPVSNPFVLLPEEMLQEIFLHSPNKLKSISLTSQHMNSVLHKSESSNLFWKSLYEKEFGGPKDANISWKNAYIESIKSLKVNETLFAKGYFAAGKGHLQLLRRLIDIDGLNPNETCGNGSHSSFLYIASQMGYLDVVKFLVNRGSNIEYSYGAGFTSLYIASQRGHLDVAKFLISQKANVNHLCSNGSNPVYIAAQEGKVDVLALLIDNGGWLEIRYRDEFSPLLVAARNGHASAIKLLIERGAHIEAASKEGATALYAATEHGYPAAVNILLAKGAQEPRVLGGYTPTFIASQNGRVEILKFLLAKFPNSINEKFATGATALYVAAQNNNLECARLLLEEGALPNIAFVAGSTALHIAAQKGYFEMVRLLVEYKADINVKTEKGVTVASMANENGHIAIANYLSDNLNRIG